MGFLVVRGVYGKLATLLFILQTPKKFRVNIRCDVLAEVLTKIPVIRGMTPCRFLYNDQCFGALCPTWSALKMEA
jgi:hypothetical protein